MALQQHLLLRWRHLIDPLIYLIEPHFYVIEARFYVIEPSIDPIEVHRCDRERHRGTSGSTRPVSKRATQHNTAASALTPSMFHVKQSPGCAPERARGRPSLTSGGTVGLCPGASGKCSSHPSASTRRGLDMCTNYHSQYPSDLRHHPRTAGPPPASDSIHPASPLTDFHRGTATDPYSGSRPDRSRQTQCTDSTHGPDSTPSSPAAAAAEESLYTMGIILYT